MMSRVVHFEIHAADPTRAAKFYQSVFGWNINEWAVPGAEVPEENRYWLVTTGPEKDPGIDGGILIRRGPAPTEAQPVNAFVCVIDVASIDESVDRAVKAGGSIALPKMTIQGVGWAAYCKDTEGNIFGMIQNDRNAE